MENKEIEIKDPKIRTTDFIFEDKRILTKELSYVIEETLNDIFQKTIEYEGKINGEKVIDDYIAILNECVERLNKIRDLIDIDFKTLYTPLIKSSLKYIDTKKDHIKNGRKRDIITSE